MARIFYIHWNKNEALQTVADLRARGHEVRFHSDTGEEAWKLLRKQPPDVLVVSLERLPSHGRQVASVTRESNALRGVPIVFVGGQPEKAAVARQEFPAARFCTFENLHHALAELSVPRSTQPSNTVSAGSADGPAARRRKKAAPIDKNRQESGRRRKPGRRIAGALTMPRGCEPSTLPRLFAVIPAAGYSRRMGFDKQLIDVGGGPMIAGVVKPLMVADIAGMCIVTRTELKPRIESVVFDYCAERITGSLFRSRTAPRADLAADAPSDTRDRNTRTHPESDHSRNRVGTGAEKPARLRAQLRQPSACETGSAQTQQTGPIKHRTPRVFIEVNDNPEAHMIDSIRAGLSAWAERRAVRPADGFLVCPADHPGIATADFDACINAFRARPESIVVGTHHGRRGHPIIFPASDAAFVHSSACDRGLNALPRAMPQRVIEVACASNAVIRDIDTPADLA